VVEATRRWVIAGGAANAAANAAQLGGRPILGGATGNDPAADELARLCRSTGIDPSGLVPDPNRPTTVKLRVLARNQQVIRVDTESTVLLPAGPADLLAAWAERAVAGADAVLLSDYGKGVIDGTGPRVIAAARSAGRPVVVDPKGTDPTRYLGARVIKPNLSELADLTRCAVGTAAAVRDAGRRLADALPGTDVLVTRGPDGMALFRAGSAPQFLAAAPARRVYDVTGAGDTVAATLALSLAAAFPVEVAARVANAAAGVVVGKVGTAAVTPAELLAVLSDGVPDFEPFVE
jgi:D-beta-D-heptose 7-phosphate kinase/D-beta-D-heptose 1-phosphate adenosyltransferase